MRTPLSQSQLGVYYACVTNKDEKTKYQNPILFDLPQDVAVEAVRKAVYDALCAHPYLASRIVLDDEGVPVVESGAFPALEEAVPVIPVNSLDEVSSGFGKTMDVHAEKLYRAEIYQHQAGAWLYIDFHHVISDGFSMVFFLRELERAFNGKKPAGEMLDGGAIATEEEALRADENKMAQAREWYAKTFCDAAETDSLPLPQSDLSDAPAEMIYKHYPLSVSKEEVNAVMRKWDVKESTLMQAAWGLLLAAYGADDKASWCTAFFGRSDRRTLSAITMMVHTLPVFLQAKGEETLGEVFSALSVQMDKAQQLQYYAYQDAVKDLGLTNQVMFVYQGSVLASKRGLRLGESMVPCHDLRQLTPGWKLVAELFENEGKYSLKLGFSTSDYSEAYMQELVKCYSAILVSMVKANAVKDLEYVLPEQAAWLNALNPEIKPTQLPSLVERFKQHVAERPNDIFVVAGDKRLTFAQVDQLTDTIDPAYTVRCGKQVVGFSVPRDEKMVLAPLAIAKAGLTQLPLDASYPEERLAFMKKDASAYDGKDALVLLYTSGTTGTPKGVILTEENFRQFVHFHTAHIGLEKGSRYASYAGYGFDAYQHDLWACVWAGATIYIIQDDIRFDLEGINNYLQKEGITHIFMTTQMATQMALNYPDVPGLQWLGTGGEKLLSLDPPSYIHGRGLSWAWGAGDGHKRGRFRPGRRQARPGAPHRERRR